MQIAQDISEIHRKHREKGKKVICRESYLSNINS